MFSGFNGIRTHGLCVSAAVLHQLSYEDPYVGSRPIYWIHRTRERNETYEYYVNCGHTNEMKMWSLQLWLRFKQSQIKPEKCFRGFSGIRQKIEQSYSSSKPLYWWFLGLVAYVVIRIRGIACTYILSLLQAFVKWGVCYRLCSFGHILWYRVQLVFPIWIERRKQDSITFWLNWLLVLV